MAGKSALLTAAIVALAAVGCKDAGTAVVSPSLAHGSGQPCSSCHSAIQGGWSHTLHAASASDVLTNTEHNSSEQLIDECIQCHAPFQAARFHIGSFVQPVDTIGPWHVLADTAALWEAIKCQACHDPASNAPQRLAWYNPVTQAYEPVKDATELCEKCHQKDTDDSRDLAGSVHEGLQCTDCHFQAGSAHSLDPTGACARCHPAVNPNHPDVTRLPTTYAGTSNPVNIHFAACSSCHGWALP